MPDTIPANLELGRVHEHVLLFGREEGMVARYQAAATDVSVSVICRIADIGRIRDTSRCTAILPVPDSATVTDWCEAAMALHRSRPVTRLASFGERDGDKVAAVGAALGLPSHSMKTTHRVFDKHAMRAHLRACGLDDTPAAAVSNLEELRAFAAAAGYPVIVKPRAGVGSVGIGLARCAENLESALPTAKGGFTSQSVVAEAFLEGTQYSVETLSEAGEHVVLAITRKYSDPVRFVELGHLMPAPLSVDDASVVQRFTTDIRAPAKSRFMRSGAV